MSKFKTARTLWQKDKIRLLEPIFFRFQQKGFLNWMSDEAYLKCAFRLRMGYPLNLKSPKTFNEKLQWLKLYDYKPEYDNLVDKYEVKKYISEKIGGDYVVPTYGVWDSVEDIDWNSLPNQFVIKTTHGSGGHDVFICRDKSKFDIEDCKAKLRLSMSQNTYWFGRERPYKNLKPRIMAEELLVAKCGDIEDYKVHSCNGIPEFLLVCRDRYSELGLTEDFFTDKWEHLDVKRPTHPNASVNISRPKELDEMLELSERLSKGIPFVRSDFYVANSKVYFGELTFYPASGFVPFKPNEWDEKWGKLLTLPNEIGGGNLLIYNNVVMWVHVVGEQKDGGVVSNVNDYKFMCFDGQVSCSFTCTNRFQKGGLKVTFYDREWNMMPFQRNHPKEDEPMDKPKNYYKMIELAEILSSQIPFVRVDFYEVNGSIYFGELTFYPGSGYEAFQPNEWDYKIGNLINLHTNNENYICQ